MRLMIFFTFLFALCASTVAADGPWQGRWKDSYNHDTTFIQDGNRVYDDEWIDGVLSPDGTVLRGFWVLNGRAGYFEYVLSQRQ